MEKHVLKAQKRDVVGRKVKSLRKKGQLPANIYGKKVASTAVTVEQKEFETLFAKIGQTGLIELQLEGSVRPVLVHNIAYDPVNERKLHVDFYQVDLKEKVSAKVPLEFTGEAKAVKDKIGVLLHILSEVEVEALPADLPEKIFVDISHLAVMDEIVKVKDLKVSDKVKIITDPEHDIVKVAPLVSKAAEKMAAEEAAAAAAAASAAAAVPAEASEAKAPAASEAAAVEGKAEAKPAAGDKAGPKT